MTRAARADDLRSSLLFAGLPPALLQEVLAKAELVTLSRGDLLWRAGETASHVGLLLSGRVKSWRPGSAREVILDIAMPGDVLGDVAFALGEPHQASTAALRRARVLLIPASAIRRAFAAQPDALTSALVSLARRAQRLMGLVETLSAGRVDRRLAAALVTLADRVGEPFPGGILVPLRLERSDLASLAATSAESVSRHLSEWERQGLVRVYPAGYLLQAPGTLRSLAAGRRGALSSSAP